MNKKNVLFLRKPSDTLKEKLEKNLEGIINFYYDTAPFDEIDIIIGWRVELAYLKKFNNLKYYINPGTGVQHLIGEISTYFKLHGITLINGHGNSYFTASHAVAMLLTISHRIEEHHQWMKQGLWRRGDTYAKSLPLKYRTVGIMGYGAIGKKIHQFLEPFGCSFALYRRKWENKSSINFNEDELNEFLSAIDTLIIALPLTNKTKHMIGKDELQKLGKAGIVINIGRGDVINEDALYDALKYNNIHAAGIDVWYNYNPEEIEGKKYPYTHPFHELDNILLSPHRAASPFDDIERWDEVIHNLNAIYQNSKDSLLNIVDLDEGY